MQASSLHTGIMIPIRDPSAATAERALGAASLEEVAEGFTCSGAIRTRDWKARTVPLSLCDGENQLAFRDGGAIDRRAHGELQQLTDLSEPLGP